MYIIIINLITVTPQLGGCATHALKIEHSQNSAKPVRQHGWVHHNCLRLLSQQKMDPKTILMLGTVHMQITMS